MQEIIVDFAGWYLVVQLITVVALPLTFRLFSALPDRGSAFAKSVGILGTGTGLLNNVLGSHNRGGKRR